jgi:methionine biosynthesis protein MetW
VAQVALPDAPDVSGEGTGGFLLNAPDPLRYDGNHDLDPFEVSGIISGLVPRGARVLDVGCGTGALSVVLRDVSGAEVTGIEPDAARAALARERGLDVITGVLTGELHRTLGTFDAVIYADVLEHLPDPLSELKTAAPFVKPNGVVIVSVPNIAHWSVRLDLLRGRFRYTPYGILDATHLRFFTEETVLQVMAQAGLDVASVQHTAGVMLQCYRETQLGSINEDWRSRQVRRLTRRFPRLFGCQHVVVGRVRQPRAAAA